MSSMRASEVPVGGWVALFHIESPLTMPKWPGTSHLLNGGLQGHMEIVHACQLHRLIYALGCQRVSSEDGIGVPGKQHWGDVRLAKARREQASESLATGWGRGCGRPGALWEMLYLNSSFAIDVQSWMDHLQGHGLSA